MQPNFDPNTKDAQHLAVKMLEERKDLPTYMSGKYRHLTKDLSRLVPELLQRIQYLEKKLTTEL